MIIRISIFSSSSTGIKQILDDDIILFPNPTSDIINITGLTQPSEVKLYSVQGRLVKSINQVESSIDISDLPTGIHILNLTSGKDVLTYEWSVSGGEYISSTTSASVIWKAPTSAENEFYTLRVEVSDGELTASADYLITVEGGKFIDLRDDNVYKFADWRTDMDG